MGVSEQFFYRKLDHSVPATSRPTSAWAWRPPSRSTTSAFRSWRCRHRSAPPATKNEPNWVMKTYSKHAIVLKGQKTWAEVWVYCLELSACDWEVQGFLSAGSNLLWWEPFELCCLGRFFNHTFPLHHSIYMGWLVFLSIVCYKETLDHAYYCVWLHFNPPPLAEGEKNWSK